MERIVKITIIPKKNGVIVAGKYLPKHIFNDDTWKEKLSSLLNEAAKHNGLEVNYTVSGSCFTEIVRNASSKARLLNIASEMVQVYNGGLKV